MLTSSKKGNLTTYRFKDYSVSFKDNKPKLLSNGFCAVMLKVRNKPVFEMNYFYQNGVARLEDLYPIDQNRIGSKEAAKEVDFLFHCLETHLHKSGLKAPMARTHKGFATFLAQRGWILQRKTKTLIEIKKKLTKRNNFLPSIMGGKWKMRRNAAQKKLR